MGFWAGENGTYISPYCDVNNNKQLIDQVENIEQRI